MNMSNMHFQGVEDSEVDVVVVDFVVEGDEVVVEEEDVVALVIDVEAVVSVAVEVSCL